MKSQDVDALIRKARSLSGSKVVLLKPKPDGSEERTVFELFNTDYDEYGPIKGVDESVSPDEMSYDVFAILQEVEGERQVRLPLSTVIASIESGDEIEVTNYRR